eukprot:1139508-Pelagomonas_calceolata.AAC.4
MERIWSHAQIDPSGKVPRKYFQCKPKVKSYHQSVHGEARGVNRKVQLHDYFLQLKQAYPTSVILVQIGSFYEASGIDALVSPCFRRTLCRMSSSVFNV